jgi:hypothetical protein
VRIDASPEAVDFITKAGGRLFVWTDHAGFGHASPSPPPGGYEFHEYPAGRFTLYQDKEIDAPLWWKIEFHHLPHHHVTAYWDSGSYGLVPGK